MIIIAFLFASIAIALFALMIFLGLQIYLESILTETINKFRNAQVGDFITIENKFSQKLVEEDGDQIITLSLDLDGFPTSGIFLEVERSDNFSIWERIS